jgi:hypothetical protein
MREGVAMSEKSRALRGLCAALAWTLFALASEADAGIIYSDDFEQFAAGSDLTTITYTPVVGPANGAHFQTFAAGGSTKTAIDFGGSRAVQLFTPVGSGIEYLGMLPASYSNTLLQFSWDTTFQALNSGMAGFFIRFPSPVFGMQVLLGYFDDGTIAVFNGVPSTATVVPIGTFDAGVTYRTQMNYDLRTSTYSVFVNGTARLLNEALPAYLNQTELDRFGFDGNEALPTSVGNTWIIDNISVAQIPEPSLSSMLLVGLILMAYCFAIPARFTIRV